MCDSSAYLIVEGQEDLVLEHIDHLVSKDTGIKLVNIFGEEKDLKARIKGISLLEHKILLEPLIN
jgi:predicted RNA-binding protein